jgi:hypothetical protein
LSARRLARLGGPPARHRGLLALALLTVVVCSGCFRATTAITVKADGSGVIDQEIGASAQAMALLRNFSSSGGDQKPARDLPMFGPEQAQAAAAAMGVRFVSGEPIKTADVDGYRAHYAFDDVTKIRLNVNQNPPGQAVAEAGKPAEPPFAFGFAKQGDHSVLTINIAEAKPGTTGLLPQMPGGGSSPQERTQALSMVLPMLRGLFVDVTLAVDGRIIKTNAPYVSGSQITLLQFDFDKVNATEGALQKLQGATDPKMLKDIPGVRMITDPVVTIEFGR